MVGWSPSARAQAKPSTGLEGALARSRTRGAARRPRAEHREHVGEHKRGAAYSGGCHKERPDGDARRDRFFTREGYRVVRVTDSDVAGNLAGVLAAIADML